jgi:cytochrome c-type biogenesis protein CcmH
MSQIAPAARELGIDLASNSAAAMTAPAATETSEDNAAMIHAMVDGLAQRLQSNPNDLEGWKRLGRSYLVLNEPIRAQEAYARAVALAPTDLAVLAGYADATMLAPGTVAVPKESIEALRKLLASDGADGTALWLVAVAESEAGNAPQATVLLQRLLKQLQPDTAAYKTVQARLDRLTQAP